MADIVGRNIAAMAFIETLNAAVANYDIVTILNPNAVVIVAPVPSDPYHVHIFHRDITRVPDDDRASIARVSVLSSRRR